MVTLLALVWIVGAILPSGVEYEAYTFLGQTTSFSAASSNALNWSVFDWAFLVFISGDVLWQGLRIAWGKQSRPPSLILLCFAALVGTWSWMGVLGLPAVGLVIPGFAFALAPRVLLSHSSVEHHGPLSEAPLQREKRRPAKKRGQALDQAEFLFPGRAPWSARASTKAAIALAMVWGFGHLELRGTRSTQPQSMPTEQAEEYREARQATDSWLAAQLPRLLALILLLLAYAALSSARSFQRFVVLVRQHQLEVDGRLYALADVISVSMQNDQLRVRLRDGSNVDHRPALIDENKLKELHGALREVLLQPEAAEEERVAAVVGREAVRPLVS